MFRAFVCASLALLLCVGLSLADAKDTKAKKNNEVNGKVTKVVRATDGAVQEITVTMKDGSAKTLKVAKDAKITKGKDKTPVSAADVKTELKEDVMVSLLLSGAADDAGSKVTAIRIRTGTKK